MAENHAKGSVLPRLVVLAVVACLAALACVYIYFGGGLMAEQTMEIASESGRCDDLRRTTLWARTGAAILSFLCGAQGLALLKDDLSKTTRFRLVVITVLIGAANAGVTALSSELAAEVERECAPDQHAAPDRG